MSAIIKESVESYRNSLKEAEEIKKEASLQMKMLMLSILDIVRETGEPVEIVNPMDSYRVRKLEITKDGVTDRGARGENPKHYSFSEFRELCFSSNKYQIKGIEAALESIQNSWIDEMLTPEMLKRKTVSLKMYF